MPDAYNKIVLKHRNLSILQNFHVKSSQTLLLIVVKSFKLNVKLSDTIRYDFIKIFTCVNDTQIKFEIIVKYN